MGIIALGLCLTATGYGFAGWPPSRVQLHVGDAHNPTSVPQQWVAERIHPPVVGAGTRTSLAYVQIRCEYSQFREMYQAVEADTHAVVHAGPARNLRAGPAPVSRS